MQPIQAFLTFYVGHLAADFLLQTNSMIEHKKAGRAIGYVEHGAAHYLAIVAVVAATAPSYLLDLRLHATLVVLTCVHLLIDWTKIRISARPARDGVVLFVTDQLVHVATVGAAALLYAAGSLAGALEPIRALSPIRDKILAVLVVYIATVFAAGYLVRYLTKPLLRNVPRVNNESREELQNAGLYIGWLERVLILTAVILRSPATIGLVLTAKSIVRYQEMKVGQFAEYFLIGTLLSILCALFGGIILLKVLYGSIHLST